METVQIDGVTQEEFDRMPAPMRRQMLESQERLNAIAAANEAPVETGNTAEAAPVEPPVETPAQPQQETVIPSTVAEAIPTPQPEHVAPAGVDVEALKADLAKAQQAYRVLQGKFNSEVPRKVEENKALLQRISALEDRLNSQPPPAPTPPKALKDRLKPDTLRELPEEAVEDIYRVVTEDVEAKLVERDKRFRDQEINPVKQSVAASEYNRFLSDLGGIVPNFTEVNVDPQFHAWLGEPDALSGMTRDDLLKQAESSRDARRVARFFQSFLSEQTTTATPPPPARPATTLEAQVRPTQAAAAPPAPAKPKWTFDQIKQIRTDIMRGRKPQPVASGKFKDNAELEREFDAAYAEGRVT